MRRCQFAISHIWKEGTSYIFAKKLSLRIKNLEATEKKSNDKEEEHGITLLEYTHQA